MAHQDLTGDVSRTAQHGATGAHDTLPIGTIIYTLDGALPVEYLCTGDRIITRAGMRVLRDVAVDTNGFTLRFDTPTTYYADGAHSRAA